MKRIHHGRVVVDSPLTREIRRLLEASSKTQSDICSELGYKAITNITMFKQGRTKLPLNKIIPFASATGGDAAHLLKLWLGERDPRLWDTLLAALTSEHEALQNNVLRNNISINQASLHQSSPHEPS